MEVTALIEELEGDLREFEAFLAELLDDTASMRSLIWARLPEAQLSPEERLEVARHDV